MMATSVYYFCQQGHMTRLRYSLCPFCNGPFIGEVQETPKHVDGWRISVTDWSFLRVQKIDPEQDEPVYR